ncbi:Cell division control protein [Heterostelium album PN500]|uniref:Cell division control protein n=1 Tax=Heterostelium pallidum (strain ATCC 26659 / Pp 5 / PN500) TaxID=670386 RepID=D3BRE6_HETP5|nr:Cell division control protein [Heterostelium album PN500]EFA75978.1 Cell division control protein [Heterostelium album PN500]|eukprot:XP_020428112.1 Cell division control protein [Heterostelium album PN500]
MKQEQQLYLLPINNHQYKNEESLTSSNHICYLHSNLLKERELRLGQWVFLSIPLTTTDNSNNNRLIIVSQIWINRESFKDNIIQSIPFIYLIINDSSSNDDVDNIKQSKQYKEIIQSLNYNNSNNNYTLNNERLPIPIPKPLNVNLYTIPNNQQNILLKIDILLLEVNNDSIPMKSKHQYLKDILNGKLIGNGFMIGSLDKPQLKVINVYNDEKIGLVSLSTKINIFNENDIDKQQQQQQQQQQEYKDDKKQIKVDRIKSLLEKRREDHDSTNSIGSIMIGGLDKQFAILEEMIIYPMLFRSVFDHLSINPPKGILLKGEPGTGKTHIVRSIATYYAIDLICVDATKISGTYLGDTEAALRRIFGDATKQSRDKPAILFIDEIDTICPPRAQANNNESRVVGQLLTLMDGIESRSNNLIVIAATNRPNHIDPALRRPGRFDRELEIPVPDRHQRLQILKLYTKHLPINVDLSVLSDECTGYVGANLQSVCRDAAFIAFKKYESGMKQEKTIDHQDFVESIKSNPPSLLRENRVVEIPTVTWDDIGGLEDVKQELQLAIEWPMLHGDTYKRLGLSPPKGILLYGPPGCSKTTLVKAIANSAKLSFISMSGANVFSPFLGDSEATIRAVFKTARQSTPSILFFDEIDAIVSKRQSSESGDSAQSRVLSTFLNEMDGFEQLKGVIVVGATNRLDMIDSALLRPGRFDKILKISLPDQQTRLKIIKVKTKNLPLESDINFEELSKMTEGYSGADIENLCKEASICCMRRDLMNGVVSMNDFRNVFNQKVKHQ